MRLTRGGEEAEKGVRQNVPLVLSKWFEVDELKRGVEGESESVALLWIRRRLSET